MKEHGLYEGTHGWCGRFHEYFVVNKKGTLNVSCNFYFH
jgi:hypothetical protein